MPRRVKAGSHRSTNEAVLALVVRELAAPQRVLDLGCGRGHLVDRLARHYESRGWAPAHYLTGADLDATAFEVPEIPFKALDIAAELPFATASLDTVVCVEVFEHAPSPYALLAEIARVLVPGGRLIFSVPNPMHAVSRLQFLLTGFYHMYMPPSTEPRNAGRLCGHIMPLPVQYWRYGLRRAGFGGARLVSDRARRGATGVTAALLPLFALARAVYLRKVRRYDARVYAETEGDIREANSWLCLTSRSLVFEARTGAPSA